MVGLVSGRGQRRWPTPGADSHGSGVRGREGSLAALACVALLTMSLGRVPNAQSLHDDVDAEA